MKRRVKAAKEEHGQWRQWVVKSKGAEFLRRFGRNKSPANVDEVIWEREEEMKRELEGVCEGTGRKKAVERISPPKKRMAEEMLPVKKKVVKKSKTQTPPPITVSPTPAPPTPAPVPDAEQVVANIIDDFDFDLELQLVEGFQDVSAPSPPTSETSEVLSHPPSTHPRSLSPVGLEIVTPDEECHSLPVERSLEHVIAPTSLQALVSEEMAAEVVMEDVQTSVQQENVLEQVTAPLTPGPMPQEVDVVVATQEDAMVSVEQEELVDIDSLFEDDEEETEHIESPPTPSTPPPTEEVTPVEASTPPPQSAPTPPIPAEAHHIALLAAKLSSIKALEASILAGQSHTNVLFRQRLELSRPGKEEELKLLRAELEVLEDMSVAEREELWERSEEGRRWRAMNEMQGERFVSGVGVRREVVACGGMGRRR